MSVMSTFVNQAKSRISPSVYKNAWDVLPMNHTTSPQTTTLKYSQNCEVLDYPLLIRYHPIAMNQRLDDVQKSRDRQSQISKNFAVFFFMSIGTK